MIRIVLIFLWLHFVTIQVHRTLYLCPFVVSYPPHNFSYTHCLTYLLFSVLKFKSKGLSSLIPPISLYYFSMYQRGMRSSGICPSSSGLIHLTRYHPVPSKLQWTAQFLFLQLCIFHYVYIPPISLSSHLFLGIKGHFHAGKESAISHIWATARRLRCSGWKLGPEADPESSSESNSLGSFPRFEVSLGLGKCFWEGKGDKFQKSDVKPCA